MQLDTYIKNHLNLTLGDLGTARCNQIIDALKAMGVPIEITEKTKFVDIPDLLEKLTPELKDAICAIDIHEPTEKLGPVTNQNPEDISKTIKKAIPDKPRGRDFLGALFSLTLIVILLVISGDIAIDSLHRFEFPPTVLTIFIIVVSGMIVWVYMGIINKERRDVLSAIVGNKVSSGTIADIIEVIKRKRDE